MPQRLLFLYLEERSFVTDDLEALGKAYEVRHQSFSNDGSPNALRFLRQCLRQLAWLLREVRRSDAILGWFADYHMVLPVLVAKLFRKPVLVSLGGFDCIYMPELDYGVFTSSWRAPLARFVHRNADLLLPVTAALLRQVDRYVRWPEERVDGLLVHLPDLKTRVEVLPTGYDPDLWAMGPLDRVPSVRTVANVDSMRTARRKGIDLFVEVARMIPDVPFEVVGVRDRMAESLKRALDPPANVGLRGPVVRASLPALYAETSVYAQLSRAEGMPNVLCEAMLCGCIPVASRVYGNPDAVGGAGILVDTPEPERIAVAVRNALLMRGEARQAARNHIVERFTRRHRYDKLARLIEELTVTHAQASRSGE